LIDHDLAQGVLASQRSGRRPFIGRIRRRVTPVTAATLAVAFLVTLAPTGRAIATSAAVVDPAPQQTMQGFGASGAWWTIDMSYFPKAVQKYIAQMLFTSRGIALSQYRYNIGGGGAGVTVPTGGESELGPKNRAPGTFYQGNGVYDWSKDPGGTTFLRYAGEYNVPGIDGFVNSAPPQFTTNGQSCGGALSSGFEQAFADYLVTVVTQAHNVWHTTIGHVSPMNEPDYTRSGCTQEGMQVPPKQRATVVQDVGKGLAAQAPYSRVIADESSRVGTQFNPDVPQWMDVPGTSEYIAALAHHTFDLPSVTTLQHADAIAESYGKQLWMTEICCVVTTSNGLQSGMGYDPTITGGVAMADLIDTDLTQANDAAWDWWVALSAAMGCDPVQDPACPQQRNDQGWNDGLIEYDPNYGSDHNYVVYPTKRFWVLGNFSKFVRPGAVRHNVSGAATNLDVMAFESRKSWQVVVINNDPVGAPGTALQLSLPRQSGLHTAGAFETSATHDLASVPDPTLTSTEMTASIPAQSVTTFLLQK
jgi:O-glycosyl hydrolase